jgi:regulator of sigma E protease
LKLEGKHADGTPFQITVDPDAKQSHPQIGVTPVESLTIYDLLPGRTAPDQPTFQKGDKILKVGDHVVKDSIDFHRAVAANGSGTLSITVDRSFDEAGQRLAHSKEETITTTDNYFRTLGLILDSGPIEAVQSGSPAEKAGLKKGDKLAILDGLNIGTQVDPLKLPIEFAKRSGMEINVIVTRQNIGGGQESVSVKLVPDDVPGWLDKPELPGEPLSIPSIGVAFHLLPVILAVEPDGPADKAGIKPGPLKNISFTRLPNLPNNADEVKDSTIKVSLDDPVTNNCAFAFWLLQRFPARKVTLGVSEDGKSKEVEIVPVIDTDWPLPMVPFRLDIEKLLQKADTISEACAMSIKHTRTSAINIYLTLRSLVTGRVSYKELHGPLGIAKTAYRFAQEGWVAMLLFLGFLSVNLAVLNFLPIPVLDGGHMVFLIWEACTRRKPNEKLLIGATYVGFAFLLCLMALVLYLDLFIHPFAKK